MFNIVVSLQNVSTLNNSYTNGTNTSYEDEWQACTSNVNTISNLKCSYDNDTNISYKDEWQQYKPDLDITDIIIRCVLTPLFLLIGLAGNASTIIVFHRQLKRGPTVLFILALAYCDFSFLLLRLLAIVYAWLQMFTPETVRYVRPNSFFWIALSNTFQKAGGWFVIVIVVERIAAVWFPFNIQEISTKKRAKCITTFIIIVILSARVPWNASILLFSLTEQIPSTGAVSTQSEAARYLPTRNALLKHWQTVSKVLFDILPVPLVLILNVLVIVGIRRGARLSKQIRNSHTARHKQQQRITKTLLTIAIAYCILCGPYSIYSTLVVENVIRTSDVPNMVSELFRMLIMINSIINFVIYGVTDKSVRNDYINLFRCRQKEDDRSRVKITVPLSESNTK